MGGVHTIVELFFFLLLLLCGVNLRRNWSYKNHRGEILRWKSEYPQGSEGPLGPSAQLASGGINWLRGVPPPKWPRGWGLPNEPLT